MYSINATSLEKKSLLIASCLSVILLTGCDDNDKTKNHSSSSNSSLSSIPASSASSSSTPAASTSHYLGQWHAPAYGYVLSVSADNNAFTVKNYSVTAKNCLLQSVETNRSLSDLQKNYVHSNTPTEMLRQKIPDHLPAVVFEKREALPPVCDNNFQKLKTDVGYYFDAKKDFDIFWNTFNELYVNFELRGMDWDMAYDDALASIDDVTNETELFEFLSAVIAPLGDPHVILLKAPLKPDLYKSLEEALTKESTSLFYTETQETTYQKLLAEYLQTLGSDDELTAAEIAAAETYIYDNFNKIRSTIFHYADASSDIEVRAAGNIAWFTTSDNIGYLLIDSMSEYSEEQSGIFSGMDADIAIAEATINEALQDLANTDGLIIDTRFNDGGHDQVSLTFVRHFISHSRVVYSKLAGSGAVQTPRKDVVLEPADKNLYLKPTAILVSGDTVSAAEVFTMAMSSLPQVAIVGEPTAGAFSDILIKRLTSDIAFGISNETYLDVEGNNYEGIGIPADIAVPFATRQEREKNYDAGIDQSINWIKQAP